MGLRNRNYVLLVVAAGLTCVAGGSAAADSAPVADAVYGVSGPVLRLATGSPGELGLVRELAARFGDEEPIRLEWYKAGSGAALELLKRGQADLIMVHAPEAEQAAVAAGWAARRTPIGGNAYYLVGPPKDPAGIRESLDALDALRRIASSKSSFLSRGDQSGTHRRELALWEEAGITPDWSGYSESGEFMAASLRRAEVEGAYFLTDNSTWAALQEELPGLASLYSGDPRLVNVYHGLLAPDGPAASLADRFLRFLEGPAGQAIVGDFGRAQFGAPLYLDTTALQGKP
jgi:tungstate transport system substrate-binding protein